MLTPDSPAFLDAVREAHELEHQAPLSPVRRVIEETEEPYPCVGDGGESDCLPSQRNPHCTSCHGTGVYWKLTSRRVQVGVPFEEQAAHAYIKGLHQHIRKAAKSVNVAADMLDRAGQPKQAAETRKVAQVILEPVKGQD